MKLAAFLWLFLLIILSLPGGAQGTVEWTASLSTERCNVGDQVVLELKLSGSMTNPLEPTMPDIPGISMQFAGASKNLTMINGVTSSSSSFTYILTPTRPGTFSIPAVPISVEGVSYTTRPLQLVAGTSSGFPGTGGPPGYPPIPPPNNPVAPSPDPAWNPPVQAQPVLVECEVSTRQPYVNQLVVYTFRFLHRVGLAGNPSYEPAPATGFLREDLGQSTSQVERNGVTYSVSEVKTAFFPTSPGKVTIGSTRLTCRLTPDLFDTDISNYLDPVKELTTQPIELDVQPLPAQNRPPGFSGAVGNDFSLKAWLNKAEVKAGEPVKLSLSITGNAHPDLILDPTLPNWPGVRAYNPENQSPAFEKPQYRASKIFTIPLVPQQPGKMTLDQLRWTYFDPNQRRYITLTADPMPLQVTGTAQPDSPGNATTGAQPAVKPLKGPILRQDSQRDWAANPALAALALAPWIVSLALLGAAQLQHQLEQRSQTREARLRRLERQIRQARSPEDLSQLAYQALSLKLDTPLNGLPFQRLRELMSAELVQQLEQVEADRYAPQTESHEARVDLFRRLLLDELRREESPV